MPALNMTPVAMAPRAPICDAGPLKSKVMREGQSALLSGSAAHPEAQPAGPCGLRRCPRGYSPDPNLSPGTWNAWTHTLKMLTEKASVTCTRSSALHLYEFPMEAWRALRELLDALKVGSAKAGSVSAPGRLDGRGAGCCGGLTSGVRKSHIHLDSLQEIPACTRVLKEKTTALSHPPASRARPHPKGRVVGHRTLHF